jgi:hypothetical protein
MSDDTKAPAVIAVPGEHLQKQTLTIQVFVPDHPDRTTSPIFRATRKKLIEDNPAAKCFIGNKHCDHDHPLELHHSVVEWCDARAVAWDLVAQLVPDFDWASFAPSKPEAFIDSEHNANLVLCKRHHIGADHGIHTLPYPLWRLQMLAKESFIFSPDEEAVAAVP